MQWTPEKTVTRVISRSHCIPNPAHTGLEYWKISPVSVQNVLQYRRAVDTTLGGNSSVIR